MKQKRRILLPLLCAALCAMLLFSVTALATMTAKVSDEFPSSEDNLIEKIWYEEANGGISMRFYVEFAKVAKYQKFDCYIVNEDGTVTHEDAEKETTFKRTSGGSEYKYTYQQLAKPGSKIKVGAYGYTDEKKDNETCIAVAHELTVPESDLPTANGEEVDNSNLTTSDPKCSHCGSKDVRKIGTWESDDETHTIKYQCKICYETTYITSPHKKTAWKGNGTGDHKCTCEECGKSFSGECKWKVVKAEPAFNKNLPEDAAKYHNCTYKCTVCGYKRVENGEDHNGKTKCTICGWNKKKPGKIKNLKVKVKSKKSQSKTFVNNGHWQNGKWIPTKTYHSTFKICKVNISFTPPSDGYFYRINQLTGSGTTANTVWDGAKKNGTYTMWFTSSTKKAKVKITIYNKNGIARTVTKTFSV